MQLKRIWDFGSEHIDEQLILDAHSHLYRSLETPLLAYGPRHEISNNVVRVCPTSKDSDQPAHTRSLIRAFASRLIIL